MNNQPTGEDNLVFYKSSCRKCFPIDDRSCFFTDEFGNRCNCPCHTPPQPKPDTEPEVFTFPACGGTYPKEGFSHQLGAEHGDCEHRQIDYKATAPKNQDTHLEDWTKENVLPWIAKNQGTEPEGMEEARRALILEWLAKHINQYVGGTEDLSGVCLDGWFNLEELIAAAEERGRLKGIEESEADQLRTLPELLAAAEKRTIERVRENLPKKKPFASHEIEQRHFARLDREQSERYGYNQCLQEVNEILNSITNDKSVHEDL